jgi:anthranilate phosphoribosyltransferase
MTLPTPYPIAHLIKEIGRGKYGARGISRDEARDLYAAMLDGRVSDLEMGGLMLAMRIKGETVDEIAGFLEAAEDSFPPLAVPSAAFMPVLIPSYNGARKMPNLTPLLAMLLAREGVPVLVHGVSFDPGRVTTAEIMGYMGMAPAQSHADVQAAFEQRAPVFIPIEVLAPKMAHLLSLRRILGVRNSTHTLVKIMQPFAGPALRLVSYTHPEYLEMLGEYFSTAAPQGQGGAFLMRGTEGETVANSKRANQIDWFHNGQRTVLVERQAPVDDMPELPGQLDAASTSAWIERALKGEVPIPASITEQVAQCVQVAKTS